MPDNHLRIKSQEKRQILVVDDEMINREILGAALRDDYSVIFASDGQEALDRIRQNSETLSLILLDLLMPVISGMVVLRQLRETAAWSRIPVIVMTADHDSEVASLELGAMDFIPKPYPARNIILARIRRIIELSEDRQIIHSTERDPLTGLYNREFFYNYAESFDQHHKNDPMDAIVVDINHFHLVNERYGRVYADQMLKQIALNLRMMVQNSGGIVCRREADTFMIYCPHRTDYEKVLAEAGVGYGDEGDVSGRIRLRLGVYPEVDKSLGMEQRFDRAKAAADMVRNNYSRSIAVYDSKLHENEVFAEQLTDDFDRAIRERQFKVYYQPKFDVRADKPVLASAEALIRWQHPELGLISPGIFIPLFENNGMIRRLDRYVWEEAALQIRSWKETYGVTVPVSVNVSRVDMSDPDIVRCFEELLVRTGLEPENLILEITESAYTDDEAFVISTVNALRGLGMPVEMDDFGTGYSSLGMISKLPIDALKLDMIFVRNAFAGQGDVRIIELILDIARYLGVPVIAEGVETKEQADALKNMGCDIIQGYYFSKPVPPSDFVRFIEDKKNAPVDSSADTLTDAPDHILIGMSNIDDEARREKAYREAIEKSVTYASLAQALAADYFSIYYVDTTTDRFFEFTAHDTYEDLGIEKEGEDFFNLSRRNILRVMYPEDQKEFLDIFTKNNLIKELDKNNGTFTISYRLVFDGKPTWVSMKATRMMDPKDPHIVIGVNNIDMQMTHQEEYEAAREQSLTYSRIAQALSKDYYSIYLVNIETDEFVEYSSNAEYQELHVEKSGFDFFGDCRKNVIRLVHPDDLKRALAVWEKDRLIREIADGKTFSVTYRLMFDGDAVYINCKVIRMTGEDERYIVIGISNVDAQMKRDMEYEEDLRMARAAAMRDALTGVKSKRAFSEAEREINDKITAGRQGPFAVAVCDVNGLKEINDTQGHKAGDQFIRNACGIICNQFKHSPVYRVGGDEFVAVLSGADYNNRFEITRRFERQNRDNHTGGGVVIACGLAEWSGEESDLFEQVFERADDNMYKNKKRLKDR